MEEGEVHGVLGLLVVGVAVVVPVAPWTRPVMVDGLGYAEEEKSYANASSEEHREVGCVRPVIRRDQINQNLPTAMSQAYM